MLSGHSMETIRKTTSHAARQRTFVYSRFSSTSLGGLFFGLKFKKKGGGGIRRKFPHDPRTWQSLVRKRQQQKQL